MAIHPGIFRQYDIRGIVDRDLTTEAATAIGRAYATLLRDRGIEGTVAVGRDNRPSGGMRRDALIDGFPDAGAKRVDGRVINRQDGDTVGHVEFENAHAADATVQR